MTGVWQAVAVARLVLSSYVRSGWALGELLLVLAVVAISTGGGDPKSPHPAVAYFYGLHGLDFLGATALGAVVMVRRSIGRRALAPLSRLRSRGTYVAGMMLAAIALRPPLLAVLLLLGAGTGRLPPGELAWTLPPALGLLATSALTSAVTVGLLAPFGGRRELLAAVAYATVVLWPATALPSPLPALQALAQLPLWPVAACYQAGAQGVLTAAQALAMPVILLQIAAVGLFAGHRFGRRDVVLAA